MPPVVWVSYNSLSADSICCFSVAGGVFSSRFQERCSVGILSRGILLWAIGDTGTGAWRYCGTPPVLLSRRNSKPQDNKCFTPNVQKLVCREPYQELLIELKSFSAESDPTSSPS